MRNFSQIKTDIAAVVKSAAELQGKIHALAIECAQHCEAHGDA